MPEDKSESNFAWEGMKKYFHVIVGPEQTEFWCKRCKRGWALSNSSNHPGNYLHLLDHAYGHLKGKGK